LIENLSEGFPTSENDRITKISTPKLSFEEFFGLKFSRKAILPRKKAIFPLQLKNNLL
jgi:hypothetical protein